LAKSHREPLNRPIGLILDAGVLITTSHQRVPNDAISSLLTSTLLPAIM
jgi:hypothetical protein